MAPVQSSGKASNRSCLGQEDYIDDKSGNWVVTWCTQLWGAVCVKTQLFMKT